MVDAAYADPDVKLRTIPSNIEFITRHKSIVESLGFTSSAGT
jgi:hypothetical protein